ncbi:hypothetical protein HG535_0E00450 [Zygotorulaspora mrakii]|uniref:Exonuclease domain-containing protein n=1 Tax=Zygotorulaspora mrakii TaxID=42260 RepID=A0A7H9B2S9_ZYGMR|nr:uncharacterized protein HG535_0E00450 [Zygotorulaspora mrakii]QLG72961.1 hypothetical protein HG535_0E00450 [Zygotorulaspora mrakii]
MSGVSPPERASEKSHQMHVMAESAVPNEAKEESTVNSRVARLSISETDGNTRSILSDLMQRTAKEDVAVETSDEIVKPEFSKSRKPKRRRSSAVSVPGSAVSTRTAVKDNSSGKLAKNGILGIPKKKRSSNKPVSVQVTEKAYEKGISVRDLNDLTLYLMNATNNPLRWARVENPKAIKKLVFLFVPGLETEDFYLEKGSKFSDGADNLKNAILKGLEDSEMVKNLNCFPVRSPGSRTTIYSAYSSYVNIRLSKKEKQELREELERKKITINDLLLSLNELFEYEYPIHPKSLDPTAKNAEYFKAESEIGKTNFRDTVKFDHEGSHIFALDCEMCLSEEGYVLTRVSIVDFDSNVVYDKLVKPDQPIIDYLTQYSGITEEKLINVSTSLNDVQNDILKLISEDDILIGHSLNSDLNVLKIRHPKIVDTSVIFEHKAGPPFRAALRYLAATYLDYDIQTNDGTGHDSVEDARACMDLVKLKILHGLAFGVGTNTESIFDRLAKKEIKSIQLNDYAPKKAFPWIAEANNSIRCTNDPEILIAVENKINNYDFLLGRLRGLEYSRGYALPRMSNTEVIPSPDEALKTFTTSLQRIYDKSPSGTLILAFSGCGSMKKWNELMTQINNADKAERKLELKRLDAEIEDAVARARDAVAFTLLKQQIKEK